MKSCQLEQTSSGDAWDPSVPQLQFTKAAPLLVTVVARDDEGEATKRVQMVYQKHPGLSTLGTKTKHSCRRYSFWSKYLQIITK